MSPQELTSGACLVKKALYSVSSTEPERVIPAVLNTWRDLWVKVPVVISPFQEVLSLLVIRRLRAMGFSHTSVSPSTMV